jgi:O-antigen/teichoic acid export membrane protein
MFSGLLKRALKDSNFYFISQLGVKLIGVLIMPYLARHTTPAAIGSYDLVLVFVGLISTIIGLGFDSGMSIFVAKFKNDEAILRSLFSFSLWASLVIIIAFFALFLSFQTLQILASFVPGGQLLYIAFLYLLVTHLNYTIFNFLRWRGLAGKASLSGFLTSAFGLIGGVLFFVLSNNDINQYLLGLVVGSSFGVPYSLFLIKSYLSIEIPKKHRAYCKELLLVSLPFVPNYLTNSLMLIVEKFLVNWLLGLGAVGHYAILSRFAQLPNFAMNIVAKGFQPVMFLNYESTDGIKLNKLVYHSFLVFLPMSVGIVGFFSGEILHAFGGEQYVLFANMLPAVIASTLIYGGMGINGMGFTIRKRTFYIMFISGFTILLNLTLSYFSIITFKFNGLAISAPTVAAIGAFVYTWKSEQLHRFGFSLFGTFLSYVLAVLISFYFSFFN